MMEETIRLAREAQLSKDGFGAWLAMDEDLERLIKLAISEAKDAWAEQEMDNIFQAIKIERERIAKQWDGKMYGDCEDIDIGAAIRARGKA